MKIKDALTRFTPGFIAIAFLTLAPVWASAAIYMKIQDVDGDVSVPGYETWIALDSVTEALAVNASSLSMGASRDVSSPVFNDIAVSKLLDRTSPVLRQKLTAGDTVGEVTIALVQTASDAGFLEYFRIVLTNALLTSVSMNSGGDTPSEAVTMTFEKIEWVFTPRDDKGNPGAEIKAGYDLAAGSKI